jgi:hypothetical protein
MANPGGYRGFGSGGERMRAGDADLAKEARSRMSYRGEGVYGGWGAS